jgi:hypothetical protein
VTRDLVVVVTSSLVHRYNLTPEKYDRGLLNRMSGRTYEDFVTGLLSRPHHIEDALPLCLGDEVGRLAPVGEHEVNCLACIGA